MAERRTVPHDADVAGFLGGVADEQRRADAEAVVTLMREVTGVDPEMWGAAIVGFGRRPYSTADGREHDWFAVGLAPRKASLVLYGLLPPESERDQLDALGPHTTGKGCLYVRRLAEVDHDVLTGLVRSAWRADPDDGQD